MEDLVDCQNKLIVALEVVWLCMFYIQMIKETELNSDLLVGGTNPALQPSVQIEVLFRPS